MVMSLTAGEAGLSGISGSSPHSVSSLSFPFPDGGGASNAAAGGLSRTGFGLGVFIGRTLREDILGGLSGRGATAGVVGVELLNVCTMTLVDSVSPPTLNVDTVAVVCCVRPPLSSRLAKSNKQLTASRSMSSSCCMHCRTFGRNGDREWGRMVHVPLDEEEKDDRSLLP